MDTFLQAAIGTQYTEQQARSDSIRNSDISLLYPAIDYLLASDINVVLLGKTLPLDHVWRVKNKYGSRVFVPAEHDLSDRAHIFLGSQCFFYLGSPSGAENPSDVLGRRPVANFNIPNIGSALFSGRRIYTFCRAFSPLLARNLSLDEMFSSGSIYFGSYDKYEEAGLVPIQNDSDDVLLLLKDTLQQLQSGWQGFGPNSLSDSVRLRVPLIYTSWAYNKNTSKISSFPSELFLLKHYNELFPSQSM